MYHREADDVWADEEVTLQAVQAGASARRSSELPSPEVIARLPDLDAPQADLPTGPKTDRPDGRILSPRLSKRILVGVAGLLVLAALYPFLFGRNREPEGGTPPAPDAKEAPTWAAQVTEPGTPLPGAANVSSEPETYFGPELPPLPDYINSSQIPGLEASSQPAPLGNPARAAAIDGRRLDAPTGRQSSNDTPQPSVLANQTMAIGGPMPGPAGVYADDLRRDYQADSRVGLPARQPGYSIPNGPPEPGVARLEGTIEGPAVRTTNDAARPSLY